MIATESPLIAGHPALDFVNAGAGHDRRADDDLPDYEHLLRWSERVGLISTAQAALLAEAHHPWLMADAWSEAMELRRAMEAILRAIVNGAPPPERDIATFNSVLAAALAHRRLSTNLAWDWGEHGDKLDVASWTIALSAAELVTDPARRAQIKVCDNHACGRLFLDESPSSRRRWCRMSACGNAAKVRRFRERQKRT